MPNPTDGRRGLLCVPSLPPHAAASAVPARLQASQPQGGTPLFGLTGFLLLISCCLMRGGDGGLPLAPLTLLTFLPGIWAPVSSRVSGKLHSSSVWLC